MKELTSKEGQLDQVAQMKNWKSNGISMLLLLTVLFTISMLIRTFLLLTGLLTCRHCYLPNWKKKLKIFVFLFPSFIIFILIMDQDIKNNKKVLWHINTVSLKLQGGI